MAVLTPIWAQETTPSRNDEAYTLLKTTRQLMVEEKIRWQRIHDMPYTDTVTLTQEKSTLTVDIVIDPKVTNIINRQPITRTYVFDQDQTPHAWYVPTYGGVAAHVSLMGFRPAVYAAWGMEVIKYKNYRGSFGIGPYVSGYTNGLALLYRDNMWYTVSALITIGYTWKGEYTPGFGLGIGW